MIRSLKTRSLLLSISVAVVLFSTGSLMAHGWTAPKEAAKTVNPVEQSTSSIDRGKETFLQLCAYCHGKNAQGQSAAEAELKVGPPNLVKRLAHHSDGDFHWKIQNGNEEMPSFRDDLSDGEIWDIINFIKSLK